MSRFPELAALALASVAVAGVAAAQSDLGREATPEEIAAWDIDVRPDGAGLPEGSGTVAEGEEIYSAQCASCHGVFGEGEGRWPVLAGGEGTLTSARPVKTIGSYWPYASTIFDYVKRAMPFASPHTLTDDEVYAVTAYLLNLNFIVEDPDFELSNENFVEIALPNEGNFFMDPREEVEPFFDKDPCMEDCKETVEITARARVLDVTPEGEGPSEDGAEAASMDEAAAEAVETAQASPDADDASAGEGEEEALDPDLVAAGEKVFRKCQACHAVGPDATNRVGPALNDIVGAEVAAVEDYDYSDALAAKREEGVVWDRETLGAFLEAPMEWAQGTKMGFPGLKDEEEREAVIEFLRSHAQ